MNGNGGPWQPAFSTPEERNFEYDVFLSFRGEDTRNGFTGHLYAALSNHGVRTFIDSEEFEKGRHIQEVLDVIERSEILVPIFSRRYADSQWCLMEIANIVKCGRTVVPVFFHVDPSDVRHQKGSFEAAFWKHERNGEADDVTIREWREALKTAGGISGFDLMSQANGHEANLITVIVKSVLGRLHKVAFDVAKHPIGIDSRVQAMMKRLEMEAASKVYMVGICGVGGIGKTTIAKALYNKLFRDFEGSSFIFDIRENSKQRGLASLQTHLIQNMSPNKDIVIQNVEEGGSLIKRTCGCKRVLLILDDVDQQWQMDALVGKPEEWYGRGSVIIVTTRDKRVLTLHCMREHQIYMPEELDSSQSLQLLSKHAFATVQPIEGFVELSKAIIKVTGGLPLAIEVFGSLFFDKRSVRDWENMLLKLKEIPSERIHERLKISYDGLNYEEKCIFLDIACFFIGQGKEYAMYMWDSCGYFPESAIQVLLHKCLIKTDTGNCEFWMHDQIRDMGREIVRQECISNPAVRSRMWNQHEIFHVLQNWPETRNDVIEGIMYEASENNFNTKMFSKVSNLRLLLINGKWACNGTISHLPHNLKWLKWSGHSLSHKTFKGCHLKELVVLEIHDIFQSELAWPKQRSKSRWKKTMTAFYHPVDERNKGPEMFNKLKVLDLSRCWNLTTTPRFAPVPYLVMLVLDGCPRLEKFHDSVRHLKMLTLLSVQHCRSLIQLPDSISELTSLEILRLKGCTNLFELPMRIGDLGSLKELILDQCRSLRIMPDSIGHLKKLILLSMNGCTSLLRLPNSISWLSCLKIFRLKGCSKLSAITEEIGNLESLEELVLDYCKSLRKMPNMKNHARISMLGCKSLEMLPSSVVRLGSPIELILDDFHRLSSMPGCIGEMKNLHFISLVNCRSLEHLPNSIGRLKSLENLDLGHCYSLREIPNSVGKLRRLKILRLEGCMRLQFLPRLPSSLVKLNASNCTALEAILDISNLSDLEELDLKFCKKLVIVFGLKELKSLRTLCLAGCESLNYGLPQRYFQDGRLFFYERNYRMPNLNF